MVCFVFFNDTATTEIYTLSLHDALPICAGVERAVAQRLRREAAEDHRVRGTDARAGEHRDRRLGDHRQVDHHAVRSEEHTSELQSRQYLVCRLLLEKKKTTLLTASWSVV